MVESNDKLKINLSEKQIISLGQLKNLASKEIVKCNIRLSTIKEYGGINIFKKIKYNSREESGKVWSVESVNYTEKELIENTCIVEAIKKGGLFLD